MSSNGSVQAFGKYSCSITNKPLLSCAPTLNTYPFVFQHVQEPACERCGEELKTTT